MHGAQLRRNAGKITGSKNIFSDRKSACEETLQKKLCNGGYEKTASHSTHIKAERRFSLLKSLVRLSTTV